MAKDKPLYITHSILVDGFNLMYKFSDTYLLISSSKLEEAMGALLKILAEYRDTSKRVITVFFDGKKTEGSRLVHEQVSGMDVFYSHEYSADFMIMEHIKHTLHPRELTVISSDKQVISFAKRHRCYSIKSEEFEKIVANTLNATEIVHEIDKEENPVLSTEDIEYWTKTFQKGGEI